VPVIDLDHRGGLDRTVASDLDHQVHVANVRVGAAMSASLILAGVADAGDMNVGHPPRDAIGVGWFGDVV
jgi:hypothetical protein